MKVLPWESLQTDTGQPLKPATGMKAIGYIPVYESIEAMVDDHGNETPCGTFVVDNHPQQPPERKTEQ